MSLQDKWGHLVKIQALLKRNIYRILSRQFALYIVKDLKMHPWYPDSWRNYLYEQAPAYANKQRLESVLLQLSHLPPLVLPQEIEQLKNNLSKAAQGNLFILQGGDCAESFDNCQESVIGNQLKTLMQMRVILSQTIKKPIICIGRIAGQYAKPRSSATQTVNGLTLKSYRGELINQALFSKKAREPNPDLMLKGYYHAAATLNFIRAHLQVTDYNTGAFYTSHDALHLPYEQALTRLSPNKTYYNLSTHLPWIGMRNAFKNSAHVEYMRGIQNPIGIKIGPDLPPHELLALLHELNPDNVAGRILLITRLGHQQITRSLPPLIKAVQQARRAVTWSCDPMHGNTYITHQGIKTRDFDVLCAELKEALRIHHMFSSHLGGVHFELTGEKVTECIGGPAKLNETHLSAAYHSLVDPRLNDVQALAMAQELAAAYAAETLEAVT